jgi:phage terminase large subunit GpA-like protein
MLSEAAVDASVNDIGRKAFRFFQPPPLMTVDEWADSHREMSRISNAKGGKWRTRCYQREILREMTNRTVRSVVVVGAAQTVGKTELHLNLIGRTIHLNPGPILFVLSSIEMAERISKKRVAPMMRDTSALTPLCGEMKSRKSNSTIRAKEFPGGALNIAGANTPNDLCSDPIRDVQIDEVDRCQEAAGKEGDIITLAEQRQETFGEEAFSLYTSSPSGKKPRPIGDKQPDGVSKILMLYDESDKRMWHCPCQKCGHKQTLRWSQVDFSVQGTRTDPRYICDKCGYAHTDAERITMIEAGEWIASAPFNGRRGYFLSGIYSLSKPQRGVANRMVQMVQDFLRAKRRGKEALRAWINTFLCECMEDEDAGVQPEWDKVFVKRETFGSGVVPDGVLMLSAGVDVQQGDKNKNGRLEVQVIGFGEDEEAWPLHYEVIPGDPEHPSTWRQLDHFLESHRAMTANGRELIIERCAIDTGHAADAVYSFAQPRSIRVVGGQTQRVVAVKGIKGIGLPVMNLPRKSGVKKTRLWLVSTNTAKLWIYGQLAKVTKGQPVIHFPNDRAPMFTEEYFRQLTSEPTQERFKNGLYYTEFLEPTGPNEALDTFVYAFAGLKLAVPQWAVLKLRAQAAVNPPTDAAPPERKRKYAGIAW